MPRATNSEKPPVHLQSNFLILTQTIQNLATLFESLKNTMENQTVKLQKTIENQQRIIQNQNAKLTNLEAEIKELKKSHQIHSC